MWVVGFGLRAESSDIDEIWRKPRTRIQMRAEGEPSSWSEWGSEASTQMERKRGLR